MKTKVILIFLSLLFNLQLFSQDYEPILKEGSFWDIETEYWTTGSKEFRRVQVDGEIEINNIIYTKLKQVTIQVSDNENNSDEHTFLVDESKFIPITDLYLRENIDEKKLYIFDNNQNKEFVLCDFNLSIGDTIDNYYGHQAEDISVKITDITVNSNSKKVFHTDKGVNFTAGIGKSDNNLMPYIHTIDGFTETVICNGNAKNQNNCATIIDSDYEPILKEGSYWDIKEESWDIGSSSNIKCIRRKRIQVNGDTIINNKTYKKLKHAYFAETNGPCTVKNPYTINESDFKPIKYTFLREDISKKTLYILPEINSNNNFKEFILCDFNLKIGDTLKNYYWNDENLEYTITISAININENNKKVFHTSSGHTYTEGIGKNDSNLVPYNLISEGLIESLFCNGNTQNQNNCDVILNTENHQLSSLKLFPNPVKDILTIQNTENITIKIYSIKGSLLKTSTSKNNLEIDLSSFSSGIYFLEISNLTSKQRRKFIKI